MRHSIRTKLVVSFGFCVLLIVTMVGFNHSALQKLDKLYQETFKLSLDMELATDAAHIGENLYLVIANAVINRDMATTERLWAAAKIENLEKLQKVALAAGTEEESKVREAREAFEDIIRIFEQEMLPLLRSGAVVPGPLADVDARIDAKIEAIALALQSVARSMSAENLNASKEFRAVLVNTDRFGLTVSLIWVGAALFTSTLTIRKIVRPLSEMTRAALEMEKGNYLIELAHQSRDETGMLASAFRAMSGQVERRTAELRESNEHLHREISERRLTEERLRKAHDELDIKVNERTAELSRSNERLQREIIIKQQIENALRESEQRFRQMAENVKEAFWMTDAEFTRVIYVNPAYEEIWGLSCESLYADPRSFLEVVHPDDRDRVNAALETQVRDKVFEEEEEFRVIHPDGSVRRIGDRALPILDQTGHVYRIVRVGRDITKRARSEERARQREAELAHVVRLGTMGEMAAFFAHEVTQPLSAIANYTRGCVRRLRAGIGNREELVAAMEQVYGQAERAGEIIRRLRSFARKQEPRLSIVNVNDLVQDVVSFVGAEARDKGITIRMELGDPMDPVMADRIQIEQVMLNLVRNAIESMNDNNSTRRELTVRTCMTTRTGVEVTVSDTGRGLAPDAAERVFEPFFTTKPNGMGMGLSISRSIIETHGGRLCATPAPEGGAVFTFSLPALSGAGESP